MEYIMTSQKTRDEILRDIRQAANVELENLLADYNDENLGTEKRLTRVVVKQGEVVAFVRKFIEEALNDPVLKQKLLYNLDNNVLKLKTSLFKDTGGFNKPVYGKNGEVSIEREAWYGFKMLNGKVKVDLKTIRGIVHELSHSITPKFDIERIKTARREHRPHEKDCSIGEIESKIIEKFYSEYLMQNAERLEQEGLFGLSAEQIKKDVIEMQAGDLRDLIQKTLSSQDPNKDRGGQEYEERYVNGAIFAEMFQKYVPKTGKDKTVIYGVYLSRNADMDINEAAEFLFEGDYKSRQELVEEYISERSSSSEKIDKKDLSGYKEAQKTELAVAEKFEAHKRENTLNQNEQEIEIQK
jgi:hypothetical protein